MTIPAPPPPGGYYSNARQGGVRIGAAAFGFSAEFSSPMAEFETTIETPNGFKVTHSFRNTNREDVRAVANDSLRAGLEAAARAEFISRMVEADRLFNGLLGQPTAPRQLPRY